MNIRAHVKKHEIFYTSIRTAVVMISLLLAVMFTEILIK